MATRVRGVVPPPYVCPTNRTLQEVVAPAGVVLGQSWACYTVQAAVPVPVGCQCYGVVQRNQSRSCTMEVSIENQVKMEARETTVGQSPCACNHGLQGQDTMTLTRQFASFAPVTRRGDIELGGAGACLQQISISTRACAATVHWCMESLKLETLELTRCCKH
jgi:hypothetical protein